MTLSLFETFFITHLVMDWIFQTEWEAMEKSKKWLPLIVHCSVYTLGFVPAFLLYKVSLLLLFLIFISHVILDQRKLETLIVERIKTFRKSKVPEFFWWILLIGIDQTLHLLILAVVVTLT